MSLALAIIPLAPTPASGHVRDGAASLAGVYDGSQAEVAATLLLGEDGRFQYSLSYGAIDETAAGTWIAEGNTVVLTSDPVEAPAFEFVASGQAGGGTFEVKLELPEGLPQQAFSALVTLADGSAFATDFASDGLKLELMPEERVAAVMLALPIRDVRSEMFAVADGVNRMRFRFVPHDLWTVDFEGAVLPEADGAYVLERFDRVLRFRKVR